MAWKRSCSTWFALSVIDPESSTERPASQPPPALDCLPPRTRRVILAAAIPDGLTFSDVGPIELTLRDEDGATVAHATLDAATEEQSLVLAVVYQRGDAWRFRVVGQGYACGLGALAVRHGVDVDE